MVQEASISFHLFLYKWVESILYGLIMNGCTANIISITNIFIANPIGLVDFVLFFWISLLDKCKSSWHLDQEALQIISFFPIVFEKWMPKRFYLLPYSIALRTLLLVLQFVQQFSTITSWSRWNHLDLESFDFRKFQKLFKHSIYSFSPLGINVFFKGVKAKEF